MDMLLCTGEQVSIALVAMALQELGQPAISLAGTQVGIITETKHTRARILHIQTERIQRHLNEGKVIVVAGFQGITNNEELEITTLGRGGSDTSAVALAAALRAEFCEIYTDVPGIFTTDPRLVPEAQLIDEITCDEMLELASLGAKVLHPRAVEIARNYGIPLVVRSSWTDAPGTWVTSPEPQPRTLVNLEVSRTVDNVEFDTKQAKVALLRVPDQPGVAAQVFGKIARQNVDVDLIIQSIHEGSTNSIVFTVATPMLKRAEAVAEAITLAFQSQPAPESEEAEVIIKPNLAKVSIVGAGMIGCPGVAAKMFATLAEVGVNIEIISTSEVKVSCVIDDADCVRAVAALRKAFKVERGEDEGDGRRDKGTREINFASSAPSKPLSPSLSLSLSAISPVRGVALDMHQARLAIRQVPDCPGIIAKLFGLLAQHDISIDMIIQSQRYRLTDSVSWRDIAFTVTQMNAEAARKILEEAAAESGWGEVVLDSAIAKVSIIGAGMVRQPDVVARMCEALAQHQINIQMIATSEMKISCIVTQKQGITALKAIHAAFGLTDSHKILVPA